jgi:hypothetical protein
MALRAFTVTIPTPAAAVNLGVATGVVTGKDNDAYIDLTFELSTGTKVFIGESDVSSTHYAGSCTTSKVYQPSGGAMRLGDLWAIGTAGDVLQIGALAL